MVGFSTRTTSAIKQAIAEPSLLTACPRGAGLVLGLDVASARIRDSEG
jgi:hypothetical protein